MLIKDFDVTLYALEIRRLAASYQTGGCLNDIKMKVDNVIRSVQGLLGYDSDFQVKKWSELFEVLGFYMSNTADPKWKTVITHARYRVNCKKHSAIFRRKRFGNGKDLYSNKSAH